MSGAGCLLWPVRHVTGGQVLAVDVAPILSSHCAGPTLGDDARLIVADDRLRSRTLRDHHRVERRPDDAPTQLCGHFHYRARRTQAFLDERRKRVVAKE